RRGFVYPAAEIYGGFANAWDYGPLGVEMRRNIRNAWWQATVRERDDVVGLEATIITNPKVWEASGHLASFTDPMVDCRNCHTRPEGGLPHLPHPPPRRRSAGVERRAGRAAARRAVPLLRRPRHAHGGAPVQHDAQDIHWPRGGHRQRRLPAPGDGAGNVHQL